MEQALDRITWVNVLFENSRLSYTEGQPLRLRNVSFKNCDTSHIGMMGGEINLKLAKAIEESNGRPITFVYEPPAK
jgi:hypothetical protein